MSANYTQLKLDPHRSQQKFSPEILFLAIIILVIRLISPSVSTRFSGIITHCLFEFYFNRITLVIHLLRSVITLFILLSFLRCSSSVSSCCHLSTDSTSHTFQPYQTACQAYAYLTHFSPTFLLIAAHRRPLRRCSPFLLACLLLSGDTELNPGPTHFTVCTLNIRSILHPLHSAALSDLIVSHPHLMNL